MTPQRTMDTYALDFETYYNKECSIKILGTQGYFNHPNFDAYMVTVWGSDGTRYVGDPRNFDWSILNGNRVLSHNASFDEGVYFHGVSKGWWPPALLAEWLCTADMVAFLGLPRSLKGAVNTVFGIEISKDTRDNMKGKAWESMTPDFQKEVSDYALRDAEYCFNLWEKLGDKWPLRERKISAINRRIAQRGIPIDWDALQKNLGIINTALFNAESLIPWIEDYTPLSRKAFNAQCRKQNIEPPKSLAQASPEAAKWFEVNGAECVWAKAVSDYRRINSFKKKLESFQGGTLGDGRYYGGFLYFGASTGRFSGSGGNLNLQNLPRGEMFGVDFRKMIKTPEGRALVVVDLSQIEVRTLCYLAGDTKALQLIKESEDIYHAFGVLLGLHDPTNGQLKKYDPVLRHKVKSIVLGCGYGMGSDRFSEFSGLDENEAATAVNLYRKRMKSVVNLWGHYDEGINFSIAAGEEFSVELASSRVLGYGRIKKMKDSKTGKFTNVGKIMRQGRLMDFRLWGGVVTENCITHNAEVLTQDQGWVQLKDVGREQLVWDGIDFVHHEGFVNKGEQQVIDVHGIWATMDHLFLCDDEWFPAEKVCNMPVSNVSSPRYEERLHRDEVRDVHSHSADTPTEEQRWYVPWSKNEVGNTMRVRKDYSADLKRTNTHNYVREGVPHTQTEYIGQKLNSRKNVSQAVRCVAFYVRQVQTAVASSVAQLRWAWDSCVLSMGRRFSKLLGRYAPCVEGGSFDRSCGQLAGLFPRELPLGNTFRASEEHEKIGNTIARLSNSDGQQHKAQHHLLPTPSRLEHEGRHNSPSKLRKQVGDLLNCGPRNRFAVRADEYSPILIAHNCSQGLARDIFSDMMVRVEEAGYDCIMHVHDELIVEVDEDKAELALKEILAIMSTPPEWIPDIPLSAEGQIMTEYTK